MVKTDTTQTDTAQTHTDKTDTVDTDPVKTDATYFGYEPAEPYFSAHEQRDHQTKYIFIGYEPDDAHLHDPAEIERLTHIIRQRVHALRAA